MLRRSKVFLMFLLAAAAIAPPAALSANHNTAGAGGAPLVEHSAYTDVLAPDDFFIDLCGITTTTTVKEVDILKTWPDGSQTFHVERSFVISRSDYQPVAVCITGREEGQCLR